MKSTWLVCASLLLSMALSISVKAQKERPIPYPVFYSPQFEAAIEKGSRTESGAPGPNYWTNYASYTINAVVSPTSNHLQGEVEIVYKNNSPDTLERVVVQLRQNVNKEGSIRNRSLNVTNGVNLSKVIIGDRPLVQGSRWRRSGYSIYGTQMNIWLTDPLLPGNEITLEIGWNFEIPPTPNPRMGTDDEVYYLAYWYPQMAVYDDVNGWDADLYMGNGEYYMGYADYDVKVTLPQSWIMAATGELQNAEEILSETALERLARAAKTKETVAIVTEQEMQEKSATQKSPHGSHTWHFKAENVRDFAFGASDKYVWDATSADTGEGTSMIHAFYRPEKGESWKRAAEFGQFSIEHLSQKLLPYPWPHMTIVEGLIGGGMEYPMMTLIGGGRSDRSLFGVTYHEIAHMWFPMIIGQDEKAYTWMDEGLTTFNTNEGSADFWKNDPWSRRGSYMRIAGSGMEVEPMRHGDQYPVGSPARGIASYGKPGLGLHIIRSLYGQEQFEKAYREYASRWAFKHPLPYDLFNTFEDVLGEDMDWFWTSFYYQTWTLDLAVADVKESRKAVEVTIQDKGLMPVPVPVRVIYEDDTMEDKTIPVEVWLSDKRETTLSFKGGKVKNVVIDPKGFLPDTDRSDNSWIRP